MNRATVGLLFVLAALIVIVSNHYDWDHFLAFMEVEYRSWVLNHEAPLWTYQLCGGSSRLGDPQSFGLSPLFIFILIFGSFWGAKLLVISCMAIGFYFLFQSLQMLCPLSRNERSIHLSLCASLLFGGFLIWHLHAGHITFALIPFGFSFIYYFLKSIYSSINRRDCLFLFIFTTTYLTAGFYASAIFFFIPAGLAFGLPLLIWKIQSYRSKDSVKDFRDGLWKFILSVGAGVAVSSYKWVGVLAYQSQFPRTLEHRPLEAPLSFGEVLLYQMLPAWNRGFLGGLDSLRPYSWYEYSAFSPLLFLAIGALIWTLCRRRQSMFRGIGFKSVGFVLFSGVILFGFVQGDYGTFSLHRLFNENLYQNSVRVVGRYIYLFQIIMVVLLAYGVKRSPDFRAFFLRWMNPFTLGLLVLFLGSFIPYLDFSGVRNLANLESAPKAKMNEMRLARTRSVDRGGDKNVKGESFMYEGVKRGEIVPNCYQPLRRERLVTTEIKVFNVMPDGEGRIPLFDAPSEEIMSQRCVESIYLTQNQVLFSKDECPRGFCLNINSQNIYVEPSLSFSSAKNKYCY